MSVLSPTTAFDAAAAGAVPVSLLRIWSRKAGSWLSFTTAPGDRYFVGSRGYFLELSDGSLAPVSLRLTFPVIERFPCLTLAETQLQEQYGRGARLIAVPEEGPRAGKPRAVDFDELLADVQVTLAWQAGLDPVEQYIALRAVEAGLVDDKTMNGVINGRSGGRSLGQRLLDSGYLSWEPLLAVCLDTRAPQKLDPPSMKAIDPRREWELTGELLIAMGRIGRRHLEEALKIKRDGSQALGQVLTMLGSCTDEDVRQCLILQQQVRSEHSSEVGLIGQLLVSQGIVHPQQLEEALRNQKVGRQSLERVLLSMGACSSRDIEDFVKQNGWHSFQGEIDDIALGHWLMKVGTINRQQLEEALRIQTRGRQVLGELLVTLRLCDSSDIEAALSLQKNLRTSHVSGIEKLGAMLLRQGKITQSDLDKALQLQSIGRQPLGCILAAMGACSTEDVELALDIQRRWRDGYRVPQDRLGEVLAARGALSAEALDQAFERHVESGQPLGRILVESDLATPETIISTLLERDRMRQEEFRAYLASELEKRDARGHPHAGAGSPLRRPASALRAAEPAQAPPSPGSVLDRLASWVRKRAPDG